MLLVAVNIVFLLAGVGSSHWFFGDARVLLSGKAVEKVATIRSAAQQNSPPQGE